MDGRYFVAFDIDDESKEKINVLKEKCVHKVGEDYIKYVKKENIHITLVFIGSCEDKKIDDVKKIIDEIENKNVKLNVKKIRFFPDEKRMRVAVLEISDPGYIGEAQKLFVKKLNKITHIRTEKEYIPHITIARVNNMKYEDKIKISKKFESVFEELKTNLKNIKIKSITLYNSVLTINGPIYEVVYRKSLSENK